MAAGVQLPFWGPRGREGQAGGGWGLGCRLSWGLAMGPEGCGLCQVGVARSPVAPLTAPPLHPRVLSSGSSRGVCSRADPIQGKLGLSLGLAGARTGRGLPRERCSLSLPKAWSHHLQSRQAKVQALREQVGLGEGGHLCVPPADCRTAEVWPAAPWVSRP